VNTYPLLRMRRFSENIRKKGVNNMNGLATVTKMVEELLEEFHGMSISDVVQYINSIYDYNLFLKQLIYEIYYSIKLKVYEEENSILNSYKERIPNSINKKSIDFADDSEYAKEKRTYVTYRGYQDELAKKANLFDQVKMKPINTATDRYSGYKLKKYEVFQLIQLKDVALFKYLMNNSIPDSKRLSNDNIIREFNELNKIYNNIINSDFNYFEKTIQFSHLELSTRFETNFKIAKMLSRLKCPAEDKAQIAQAFKCLRNIYCPRFKYFECEFRESSFESRFIMGIDIIIGKFIDDPNYYSQRFKQHIFGLAAVKSVTKKSVIEKLGKCDIGSHFVDIEVLCKNYIGEGQHIDWDKNWGEIKLKYFRKLY